MRKPRRVPVTRKRSPRAAQAVLPSERLRAVQGGEGMALGGPPPKQDPPPGIIVNVPEPDAPRS